MKPGDRCRWSEVPPGSLVRDAEGDYAVRLANGRGLWVYVARMGPTTMPWRGCGSGRGEWPWRDDGNLRHGTVTLIAVDLRGYEGAGELRRRAIYDFAALVKAGEAGSSMGHAAPMPEA